MLQSRTIWSPSYLEKFMQTRAYRALLASSTILVLTGCGEDDDTALITNGMFQADMMSADLGTPTMPVEPTLLAKVSRESETVVFTLADGTTINVKIQAQPKENWTGGCATMSSHVDQEVVRLTPGPITLANLTFTDPMLEPVCHPDHISLHEFGTVDEHKWISFWRVK